jgi:hypothetical protein
MRVKSWTNLWKVNVTSKIRVFLWRLAKQSLPTGDLLHHRHIATSSSCLLCGRTDSWRHSLLECPMARSAWALTVTPRNQTWENDSRRALIDRKAYTRARLRMQAKPAQWISTSSSIQFTHSFLHLQLNIQFSKSIPTLPIQPNFSNVDFSSAILS